VREPPIRLLVQERRRAKRALEPVPGTAQWESIGPTNIGGRMTCVVCNPTEPDRIWAGAAGGGVWQSDDAGQTWRPLWHNQDILNVGSLALDPNNPDIIYCGTGEANLSADSYPGVGIFRSDDAGKTWKLWVASAKVGIPRRIGAIAIDPFDSNHIRIGGVGHQFGDPANPEDMGGMYVSRDGGLTWSRESFISSQGYWAHAILFHPSQQGTIFAAFTEEGSKNGIWRTQDGGNSWQQLTQGLPAPEYIGRTSLAIAPSNPDVLYAFARDESSGREDRLLGVFRSANGGNTWKNIAGNHFNNEGQISYGNTIAVHPKKPNYVICGGVDLHLTTDGGNTWKAATKWNARRGAPNYAHADHHCLLMPAEAEGRIYDMNDGGMDVSEDGGKTWSNRSNGLAATMFYDMDVAQSNSKFFGGGAQDNGTLVTTDGQGNTFFELLGGDGGWMVYDPNDPQHLYASYYNLHIWRWRPNEDPQDVSPPAPKEEQDRVWMAFIDMDPSNAKIVFTGSARVWRTKNDAESWQAVSPDLDGSPISAIEIARADSQRVYVGTENGGFFCSLDGGDSWSANLAGATLPGHTITRLAAHPTNADVVYATVANFGHGHVFRSNDAGQTWADMDKGQLPDVPHHAIAIPTSSPDSLYVCNDAGVYASTDGGQTWQNFTRNLPNVMVIDLVYHEGDGTLHAATYGRSLWRIQVR
jgi:photosystem II stability/assembly factor-like uncharacterized protein